MTTLGISLSLSLYEDSLTCLNCQCNDLLQLLALLGKALVSKQLTCIFIIDD